MDGLPMLAAFAASPPCVPRHALRLQHVIRSLDVSGYVTRCQPRRVCIATYASTSPPSASPAPPPSPSETAKPDARVLVLGGSGRVGTQTILSLTSLCAPLRLHIGVSGRDTSRLKSAISNLQGATSYTQTTYAPVALDIDADDPATLAAAFRPFDVIVHTAGPFQRRADPTRVLRAALSARARAYLDVCDDSEHLAACLALHDVAAHAGCAAVAATGIYPGLSNVLARHAANRLPAPPSDLALYYHTAGSGGIGATVLASTFLLLSESATEYLPSGQQQFREPASAVERFDFGGRVGRRATYLLSLPEVHSLRKHVCRGGVRAKFSTAPPIWNWLLIAMARVTPRDVLRRRRLMRAFASFSMPIVRAVDAICGARTVIVADVRGEIASPDIRDGEGAPDLLAPAEPMANRCVVRFEHESLSVGVGDATAAFARQLIEGVVFDDQRIAHGVWVAEQLSEQVCTQILRNSCRACDDFSVALHDTNGAVVTTTCLPGDDDKPSRNAGETTETVSTTKDI